MSLGKIVNVCAIQLSEPRTSLAATVTSCALTVIDVASTIFSAGANPFVFGMGALTGFATSVCIENGVKRGLEHADTEFKQMFGNFSRCMYSLFIGALPVGLAQISSFAQRYYSSSLLLGFRLGAMATHTYQHIQVYRLAVRQ